MDFVDGGEWPKAKKGRLFLTALQEHPVGFKWELNYEILLDDWRHRQNDTGIKYDIKKAVISNRL